MSRSGTRCPDQPKSAGQREPLLIYTRCPGPIPSIPLLRHCNSDKLTQARQKTESKNHRLLFDDTAASPIVGATSWLVSGFGGVGVGVDDRLTLLTLVGSKPTASAPSTSSVTLGLNGEEGAFVCKGVFPTVSSSSSKIVLEEETQCEDLVEEATANPERSEGDTDI